MAVVKQRQQTVQTSPDVFPVSRASTGNNVLTAWGVTVVEDTSTGIGLTLPTPIHGVMKTIVSGSTEDVLVYSHSTAVDFLGSTSNTATISVVGATLNLFGYKGSTGLVQWALAGQAGTTGSYTLTTTTGA